MRPQQKSFVVEIKSKGRRAAARQGSIWGTTDLKAIARQAADVAPQLFEASIADNEPVADISKQPRDSLILNRDGEMGTPEVLPVGSNPLAALEPEPSIPSVSANADRIAFPAQIVRRTRKRQSLRSYSTKVGSSLRSLSPDAVELDDLALLEVENVQLRLLWASRLTAENRQLRNMLRRFDAV